MVLGKSPDMGPYLACLEIARWRCESEAESEEMATENSEKVSFPRVFSTLREFGLFGSDRN